MADLAVGETAEGRILEHLATAFPDCSWIKAAPKSKHMDLICIHCGESVEVKTDRKAGDTGNLCFEANLFIHSKADRIFYVVGDMAYAWRRETLLLQLLVLHASGKTRGLMGGDGWKNPLILAKLEDITIGAEEFNLGGTE